MRRASLRGGKKEKKRGKFKERKGKKESEGVVGRGTVTEGIMGFRKQASCMVCVFFVEVHWMVGYVMM